MATPNRVGVYRSVHWRYCRICDVLAVPTRARWYFVIDRETRRPTSDHYPTLAALREAIDAMPPNPNP